MVIIKLIRILLSWLVTNYIQLGFVLLTCYMRHTCQYVKPGLLKLSQKEISAWVNFSKLQNKLVQSNWRPTVGRHGLTKRSQWSVTMDIVSKRICADSNTVCDCKIMQVCENDHSFLSALVINVRRNRHSFHKAAFFLKIKNIKGADSSCSVVWAHKLAILTFTPLL